MDLAAGSAIAAATAIDRALDTADFSQKAMDAYRAELDRTFAGSDMKTYARTPAFLETERMYREYGLLLADVLHGLYDLDLTPRRHILPTARTALKQSGMKITSLIRDGIAATRAL